MGRRKVDVCAEIGMARPVLAIRWNGLQFYSRRSPLGLVRLDRISYELIASPNCLRSESPRARRTTVDHREAQRLRANSGHHCSAVRTDAAAGSFCVERRKP